ncbi:MAG: hypothetical protein R6V32_00500 [Bacteroidales bacterium]
MMKKICTYGFILFVTSIISGCYEIEEYPPEPEIEYKSFLIKDTIDALDNHILSGTLKMNFVDGDGDIGHESVNDTATEDTNKNVFIDLLKKEEGVYNEVELTIPYEYRIPYFETTANNPTLKGKIIVSEINFDPPYEGDTIKLRFYIIDRAGNKSNIEITPAVVLKDSLNSTG